MSDLEKMRAAGKLASKTLDFLKHRIVDGITVPVLIQAKIYYACCREQ